MTPQCTQIPHTDIPTKVLQIMRKAASIVNSTSAFAYYHLARMRVAYTRDVKSYATDGTFLYVNPDVVAAETVHECAWTLLHESMHRANGHHLRMGTRDHQRWNIATDLKINRIIQLAGTYITVPGDVLKDDSGLYDGLSAEKVYELRKKMGYDPTSSAIRAASRGEVMAAQVATKEIAQAIRDIVQDNAQAAANSAEGGKPGSGDNDIVLKAFIAAGKPVVNWEDEIENLLAAAVPHSQTYSTLHRGMFANGTNYPGTHWSKGAGRIGIEVDVSGSIDEIKLSKANREIMHLIEQTQPEEVVVVYCSTRVTAVDRFERGDDFHLTKKGGGGTYMNPGIERLIEELPDMDAFILFTDLELPERDLSVNMPCQKLVITTGQETMPSGCTWRDYKVVKI